MALNINGTTGISGVDGSASAPAVTGTDSNTGINFASDTVNINTGGSARVTVDSSGNLSCTANLKVGTITDTSGNKSSTTAQIADGRAKVWIKFNQDTGSIASSLNVSSISQQAAGLHTVNFSSNMASANYVTVTGLTAYYGFGTTDLRYPVHVDDQATNLVKVRCQQVANGGGYANSANAMLAVFGD